MNDLVSIIVPIYNAENTLEKCVDSLLSQSYENIEVLLINDGSNDNSYLICKEYSKKDGRVRVFSDINHGVSYARNQGLIHAKGEYITFVDSDDYVKKDLVESLFERMSISNADLIVSDFNNKNEIKDFCVNIAKENIKQIMFLFTNYLLFGPMQKLYKTDLIGDIRFPENYQYGEDLLFNLEYLKKAKTVSYINRQLYVYCIRENSLSTTIRWDMYENDMYLHIKLLEWFKEKDLWYLNVEGYVANRVLDTTINSICLMFRPDCKKTIKETRRYYQKIVQHDLTKWALYTADTRQYSKWQLFLIRHKLINVLTLIAMIERRR